MASLPNTQKAPLIVEADGIDAGAAFSVAIAPAGIIELRGADADGHLFVSPLALGDAVISITGSGPYAGSSTTLAVTVTPAPLTARLGDAVPK